MARRKLHALSIGTKIDAFNGYESEFSENFAGFCRFLGGLLLNEWR